MLVVACWQEQTHVGTEYVLEFVIILQHVLKNVLEQIKHLIQSICQQEIRVLLDVSLLLFVHPSVKSLVDVLQSENRLRGLNQGIHAHLILRGASTHLFEN